MNSLNRRLKSLKDNGRKLVGCFPLYPPVELFHSFNLEPLVLWGLKPFYPLTARSDLHLQSFVCSVGRHLAEFVLSEAGGLLDGIFMYNACDTLRNMPEILRCGLEDNGRQVPIFKIHIPQAPRSQKLLCSCEMLRAMVEHLTDPGPNRRGGLRPDTIHNEGSLVLLVLQD